MIEKLIGGKIGGKVAKIGLDKIGDLLENWFPNEEERKEKLLELKKLEIEELKVKESIFTKLNRHERAIFPSFLLALLLAYVLTFFLDYYNAIIGHESPIVHFDGLENFCKLLMSYIFGKKTIEKFSK